MNCHFITHLKNITPDKLSPFTLPNGTEVVLFRQGEQVHAYQRYCPHQGMPLDRFGAIVNGVLICQAHNFPFCAETGEYKRPVPKCANITTFPVVVEDNQVFIHLFEEALIIA